MFKNSWFHWLSHTSCCTKQSHLSVKYIALFWAFPSPVYLCSHFFLYFHSTNDRQVFKNSWFHWLSHILCCTNASHFSVKVSHFSELFFHICICDFHFFSHFHSANDHNNSWLARITQHMLHKTVLHSSEAYRSFFRAIPSLTYALFRSHFLTYALFRSHSLTYAVFLSTNMVTMCPKQAASCVT